jgi:MFS family permease
LVSPLQGILTDRFGSKPIILASIPLFSAGVAGFYFMPARLSAFYSMWAMIPVLGVGLWPLGYLRAVSSWFDRRLGLAVGIANAGIGIGSALVPLIAGMLIARHGWRFAYLGLADVTPIPGAASGVRAARIEQNRGLALPKYTHLISRELRAAHRQLICRLLKRLDRVGRFLRGVSPTGSLCGSADGRSSAQ